MTSFQSPLVLFFGFDNPEADEKRVPSVFTLRPYGTLMPFHDLLCDCQTESIASIPAADGI